MVSVDSMKHDQDMMALTNSIDALMEENNRLLATIVTQRIPTEVVIGTIYLTSVMRCVLDIKAAERMRDYQESEDHSASTISVSWQEVYLLMIFVALSSKISF